VVSIQIVTAQTRRLMGYLGRKKSAKTAADQTNLIGNGLTQRLGAAEQQLDPAEMGRACGVPQPGGAAALPCLNGLAPRRGVPT
jgi:hypothetical protein